MTPAYKEIGTMIRSARERQELTQLELANKLGYESMQFVSLIERGMSKAPLTVIGKLAVILGIPAKKIENLLVEEYRNKVQTDIGVGKELAAEV